jgi:hypothetical protein
MNKGKYIIFGLIAGILSVGAYSVNARKANRDRLSARSPVCAGASKSSSTGSCTNYDTIDGGTDAASRTATVKVDGFNRLVANVWLTDANTDCDSLEATCSVSVDGGTTWASVTSRSISSGASTVSALQDTVARTAAVAGVTLVYDIWGAEYFKCVYSLTGTCADDEIDAQWSLSAGK